MRKIPVPEEGVESLFGAYDENLKHLESTFRVRISTQGHDLLVDGDPIANVTLIEDPAKNFVVIMKDGKVYKNSLR